MIVKAKYIKEIEVTDDITQEEIERICQYGMPDRFDCMADDIDNEKPLEFMTWEFVEDKHYQPTTQKTETKTEAVKENKIHLLPLVSVLMAFVFALIFSVIWGICKHSFLIGLINFTIYFATYILVTITVNWIRRVNKYMEGEKENV